MMTLHATLFLCWMCLLFDYVHSTSPHIVLIIADDLGWDDVQFTNNNLNYEAPETPNMNELVKDGIIFDNFYTQSICTPTRASLLTGKYPHKVGRLFTYTIIAVSSAQTTGLRTSHTLFTEVLSKKGYKVHGVGKWHLGEDTDLLPISRGFDSFYGIYSGMVDHFTHKLPIVSKKVNSSSIPRYDTYDFHDDYWHDGKQVFNDIGQESDGIHSTELFTKAAVNKIDLHNPKDPLMLYVAFTSPHSELQPVKEIVETRNKNITDLRKRQYAAMVTHMDDGVGEIVKSLKRKDMWNNTLFMFMSDHGACLISNCWDNVGGSNAPYRDGKHSMFEGGIKSASFIRSPWLDTSLRGTRSSALLHVVDVFPLFLDVANGHFTMGTDSGYCTQDECPYCSDRDGRNHFTEVLNGNNTGRDTIVHNIAPLVPTGRLFYYCRSKEALPDNYSVIRHKQYKLFRGLGEWCKSSLPAEPCPEQYIYSNTSVMLFDLKHDPSERVNVAEDNRGVVKKLSDMLDVFSKDVVDYWV